MFYIELFSLHGTVRETTLQLCILVRTILAKIYLVGDNHFCIHCKKRSGFQWVLQSIHKVLNSIFLLFLSHHCLSPLCKFIQTSLGALETLEQCTETETLPCLQYEECWNYPKVHFYQVYILCHKNEWLVPWDVSINQDQHLENNCCSIKSLILMEINVN